MMVVMVACIKFFEHQLFLNGHLIVVKHRISDFDIISRLMVRTFSMNHFFWLQSLDEAYLRWVEVEGIPDG